MVNVRSRKDQQQRQILIRQAISLGAFDDRHHVKLWMKQEFNLKQPAEKISTEYTLTDNQLKLWYRWLMYFTGQGKMPMSRNKKGRASNQQLWRMNELRQLLGWNNADLANFIKRQTGKRLLPGSLTNHQASDVITGMDRIRAELPFKQKS